MRLEQIPKGGPGWPPLLDVSLLAVCYMGVPPPGNKLCKNIYTPNVTVIVPSMNASIAASLH